MPDVPDTESLIESDTTQVRNSATVEETPEFQAGSQVTATVVQVYGDFVLADFGENMKGQLSLDDFDDAPDSGDEIAVTILSKPGFNGVFDLIDTSADRTSSDLGFYGERLIRFVLEIESSRKSGETPPSVMLTPRSLLRVVGGYRRTRGNVGAISYALRCLGLETNPHFNRYGIDDPVKLLRTKDLESGEISVVTDDTVASIHAQSDLPNSLEAEDSDVDFDPVHRISRFFPDQEITSVDRNSPIDKAITLMLMHDYSQLPVMQSERNLQGMISWRSIGTARLLKENAATVADCTERCFEIFENDSIFAAVRSIAEHDVVVVRADDNRVTGILTAADVSAIFEEISRPFILISYIENHLRSLLQANFTVEELAAAKDPSDTERTISSVSNMSFGEYVRLLSDPGNWNKLNLKLDRKTIVSRLEEVRRIRNEVMHFDPEGIEEKDILALRSTSQLLELLTNEL